MDGTRPKSVGLGGDGDEIFAIQDVERAFGVKLDYTDAPNWYTAGDVFSSLCNVLPADVRIDSDLWARFAEALSAETGVDPADIERNSPLLSHSRLWTHVANISAVVWGAAIVGVLAVMAWLVLSGS